MKEVLPGIYQLPMPMPSESALDHVNVYLIKGTDDCLLVDAGWNTPEDFTALTEQLAEIGVTPKDISRIIVTHIHPDHYGLTGHLKELTPVKVIMHRWEQEIIDTRYIHLERLLEQIEKWLRIHGVPENELVPLQRSSVRMTHFVAPASPDETTDEGDVIEVTPFQFRVLWTPGHSRGHISLYEPRQKVLLSGDFILPGITPNVGRHPQSGDNPLKDYLDSLERVKRLAVELVLPGHEHPFGNLSKRIEELVHHHEERSRNILAAIHDTPKTGYQVSIGLNWATDIGGMGWERLSPLDRRLAVMEALAHLEYMRVEGRVSQSSRNGVIYYQGA